MSKHNYSQYSKNKQNHNKPKVTETVEQFATVFDTIEEENVPEVVTTVAAPVEPAEIKMEVEHSVVGVVVGCSKLNVRSKPATDADVLVVLDANSEVEIDPARSTNDWVKIITAAGVDGFCMRKFVSVKA